MFCLLKERRVDWVSEMIYLQKQRKYAEFYALQSMHLKFMKK